MTENRKRKNWSRGNLLICRLLKIYSTTSLLPLYLINETMDICTQKKSTNSCFNISIVFISFFIISCFAVCIKAVLNLNSFMLRQFLALTVKCFLHCYDCSFEYLSDVVLADLICEIVK